MSIGIIIILIIIFLLFFVSKTQENFTIVTHKYLTQDEVNKIYSLIKTVHDIFTEENIEYYLIGGSLIGSTRHKGLIPWDDDMDIAIHEDHENFIKSSYFKSILDSKNLKLDSFNHGLKLSFKDSGKKCDWCSWNFPFVDIFLVKMYNDKIIYANPDTHKTWPEYLYHSELYPIKPCSFGPYKLKCPNKSEVFLKRAYGDDVLTHYYEEYDHKLEMPREKVKKELKTIEVVYPKLK